jgi:hypothetical protein
MNDLSKKIDEVSLIEDKETLISIILAHCGWIPFVNLMDQNDIFVKSYFKTCFSYLVERDNRDAINFLMEY